LLLALTMDRRGSLAWLPQAAALVGFGPDQWMMVEDSKSDQIFQLLLKKITSKTQLQNFSLS
jgi:hypothetical protein